AQLFYGRVSYHDYEGLAIDIDERARLVKDLGDNPVMILRNHGLLAVGTSIPLAFSNLFNLQFACETQVLAMAGGVALNLPPPSVAAHTANLAVAPEAPFGTEWPGLLRKLDRTDPSYRTCRRSAAPGRREHPIGGRATPLSRSARRTRVGRCFLFTMSNSARLR